MLTKKLAMTLLALSTAAVTYADSYDATLTSQPSPAVSTKALEVTIQTKDMGPEVYCYTWCANVNGSEKSPFTWDGANTEKFRMIGSGGTYTLSIPDIQAFYGLTDDELAGLTELGFIAKTVGGQQTKDVFLHVEQGRRDVYGGGEGTLASPYILSTAAHLAEFATESRDWTPDVYVRLDADIDGSLLSAPIGSGAMPYQGHFDGAGHTISNISLKGDALGGATGLFGVIKGAEISSLGVTGASVEGVNHVGILVGKAESGKIERCFATGDVSGNSICVGGLAGENIGAIISDCYAGVHVSNADDYATGGIVGKNRGTVRNVYATGEIVGKDYVGGIVGANYGSVSNSVAINGKVTGSYDYVARFGGNDNARNTSADNHSWDVIPNGTSTDWKTYGDHAELHSVGALADFSTFKSLTEWDFDNVWEWVESSGSRYPVLRGLDNQICVHPSAFNSILTSVEEMIADESVRLSVGPNPFDGYITISSTETLASAELYAMSGARVAYEEASADADALTLRADGLTSGVYVLRVSTAIGQVYSFKVSKR